MRHVIYAIIAAVVATFATSSLIAVATAGPARVQSIHPEAEKELVAILDGRLRARLDILKDELNPLAAR